MSRSRVSGLGSRVSLLLAVVLPWGGRLQGQVVRRELGVEAYSLRASPDRIGGALYAAWRVGPRARLSLLGGVDGGDAGTVGRAEALVHFLLSPAKVEGIGWYAGGGLGLDVTAEARTRIVALLGAEWRPGARSGWMLEGGVGGGWRFAAGWRWRR